LPKLDGKNAPHVNLLEYNAFTQLGGKEMKTAKLAFLILLMVLLVSTPVVADAYWGFAGGWIFGLGTGLIAGYALAPRPVYAAPPVYYSPPPPVVYPYYPSYVPAPVPPNPPGHIYSNNAAVAPPPPPPAGLSGCREWKLINRHWEKRWDQNYGVWRNVSVERWGWAGVPCRY
jgi:hypothetical protein